MSLTIWQTLGNTFYQGDDSRSIRTNGAAGNSDLDLIAPMGFGGNGSGASGFTPTPGSIPPKGPPLNLKPKGSNRAGYGSTTLYGDDFGGLNVGLTKQGPLPRSLTPLPDLSRISPRGVGADPIGKNLPSRRSSQASQGIRDLAEKLQGGKSPAASGKGSSASGKGLPGSPQPKTAPAPKRLPFAEPEPAPKGLLGLKPSPRPANQPKTGTPSPKNSLPAQRRDPRTAKPFPGKRENQPLGDRPPTGRSIPFTTRPPAGEPIREMFGIPFGSFYSTHGYFRGLEGSIEGEYPNTLGGSYGGEVSVSVEFETEYQPQPLANPELKFWVWACYLNWQDGNGAGQKATAGYVTTLKDNEPFYGLTEVRCLNCNPPINPIPAIPTGQVEPYQNVPPLKSPQKERPPNFKPILNGFPDPEGFPDPFPQPQPLPSPIQKPQQQPKPDADKEPGKSPSARRNPKPTPRPDVKPIPAPNTTGSGSFPKPDSTGTPEGSGQNRPGNDFNPNPNPTPPLPSPTPNYPEPYPPNTPPKPSSQPKPSPNSSPTPDYRPIDNKNPDPTNKDPEPVVQFPPFPVAPKLNSGNACKTADPCTQKISSGVDSANDKADDLGKKVKDIADVVDKAAQLLDLKILFEINDKLGPKLPGGLSKWIERIDKVTQSISNTVGAIQKKLGEFAKWARLGQLVSVLTLITTLHNALMLSRSVGETLLSMLSNGLAVFGIKDDGGNPYELGELIGKSVENMMKETISTANYTTLSTNFKKANRIYQAAANLGNSIQSLRFSVVSALETIGGWNARIGNALKRSGVVNESSYAWMNPTPNFDNKFTQALETVENTVSQIDSVASEILSAQETVTQIASQKDELGKSLGLGTEKPQTENQPQKTAAIAAKAVSAAPNIEATDLNKPGV